MDSVLAELASTKGVRSAAIVSVDGDRLGQIGEYDEPLPFAGALASTLTVRALFSQLLTGEAVEGLTIDYRDGPVMLTPFTDEGEERFLIMRLSSLADLGRARLTVRRLLARLSTA